MLEQGKISPFQLFCLITSFLIGSTVVLQSINIAGRDSWLSNILGLFSGVVLIFIITRLAKDYPGMTLIDYLQKIFGKALGKFLGFIYLFYFLLLAALVTRNYDDLFVSAIMPETPTWFFHATLALTVAYLVYHRIEVMGRLSELVVPISLLVAMLTSMLLTVSGLVRFENLLPIFDRGVGSVLIGTIPYASFPYLEVILFTMVIPYVNDINKARTVSLISILVAGTLLTLIFTQDIAIFGEYMATLTFPRFSAIRLISVGDFVERIEPMVLAVWVASGIIKIGVCLYAFTLGIAQLFGLKELKHLVFPSSILVMVVTGALFENNFQMINFATNIYPVFAIPLQIGIPGLMLLLSIYKRKKEKKNK